MSTLVLGTLIKIGLVALAGTTIVTPIVVSQRVTTSSSKEAEEDCENVLESADKKLTLVVCTDNTFRDKFYLQNDTSENSSKSLVKSAKRENNQIVVELHDKAKHNISLVGKEKWKDFPNQKDIVLSCTVYDYAGSNTQLLCQTHNPEYKKIIDLE